MMKKIYRAHSEVLKVVEAEEEKLTKEKSEAKKAAPSTSSGQQTNITQFVTTQPTKVVLNQTRDKFKLGIVKLIVNQGLSFLTFESEGFDDLNGEMARKLNVSLDKDQVRKYVIDVAAKEKKKLIEEIDGRLVHVKLDCATRIRTNYLAVSIRYVDESFTPVTRTLGIRDTCSRKSIFLFKL